MRRSTAAAGTLTFFVLAPGVVAGLVPWWITRWQIRRPLPHWAPVRVAGVVLLIAGMVAAPTAMGTEARR